MGLDIAGHAVAAASGDRRHGQLAGGQGGIQGALMEDDDPLGGLGHLDGTISRLDAVRLGPQRQDQRGPTEQQAKGWHQERGRGLAWHGELAYRIDGIYGNDSHHQEITLIPGHSARSIATVGFAPSAEMRSGSGADRRATYGIRL